MTAPLFTTPNGANTKSNGTVSGGVRITYGFVAAGADDDKPYMSKPSDTTSLLPMQRIALLGNQEHAFMTMPTNATETTIVTQSVPVKVAGTWTDKSKEDFTIDTTGKITYTGTGGKFCIDGNLRGDSPTGANICFTMFIAKNGTVIADSNTGDRLDSSDFRTFNLFYMDDLATNDFIEIFIQNDVNTTNITMDMGKIRIFLVPTGVS